MPASREHIFGRAVRDHHALPEQHDARRQRGGELGVVRGDHDRGAPIGELSDPGGQRVLVEPVHPAGRLVQENDGIERGGVAGRPRVPREHDLQCEALALTA